MAPRSMPDPAAMMGTYDTTDTAGPGAPHTELRGVTRAFDLARASDLAWALRAMDPEDEDVSPNVVQTSPGLTVNRGDPDEDKRRVTAAADRARAALEESGLTVDPVSGAIGARDHSAPWMSHATSMGPMVTVEDPTTDRSAGLWLLLTSTASPGRASSSRWTRLPSATRRPRR